MKTPIIFRIVDANPPLCIEFNEAPGLRSKKSVSVAVSYDDLRIIASTGFDAPSCGLFETTLELGVSFCGGLYKNKKHVGEIAIGNDGPGSDFLAIRIKECEKAIYLTAEDLDALKALFSKIAKEL